MLRTVSRAGLVLDLFSAERAEWRVTEVARELEVAKSQAHELLVSLADIGLLERVGAGRYRLGWRIVALGSLLLETTGLRREAVPAMQSLAGRYGETLHLAVWERRRPVCIATFEGRHPHAVSPWPLGDAPPAHCTALGKVLLASRPGEELDGLLDRDGLEQRTRSTIVTFAELSRELAGVRDRGFAHEEEEYVAGACAVAAPIVHRRGAVMAAVSMSAPAHRWHARKDEYTRALVTAAAGTSKRVMRRSAMRADGRETHHEVRLAGARRLPEPGAPIRSG